MRSKEENREYMKVYYSKNKEKFREINKKNRSGKNREKYLEGKKKSYIRNKKKIRDDQKKYYLINKEKISQYNKGVYIKNKKKHDLRSKLWREKNPEQNKKIKKIWYEKNKYKRTEKIKLRKLQDPLFKLKTAISNRIRNGIKSTGFCKKFKTKEILGCTYEEFKIYLESKWDFWMNWKNYGLYNGELNYGWDLDHIIPISYAKNEKEVLKLNHHTNFQPLCSKINRDIKWKNKK